MKYTLLALLFSFSFFSPSLFAKGGEGETKPLLQFAPYWGHSTALDSVVIHDGNEFKGNWWDEPWVHESYVFDAKGNLTEWTTVSSKRRGKQKDMVYDKQYRLTYDEETGHFEKVTIETNRRKGEEYTFREEYFASDSSYIGNNTFKFVSPKHRYIKVKLSDKKMLESIQIFSMNDKGVWRQIDEYKFMLNEKSQLPAVQMRYDVNKNTYNFVASFEYVSFDKNGNWVKRYVYTPKPTATSVKDGENGYHFDFDEVKHFKQQFQYLYYRK